MRFLYVSQEAPYPPTHGGRVDIWRRIRGLHELGHSIDLVTWMFDDVKKSEIDAAYEQLEQYTTSTSIYPMRRRWTSIFHRLLWALAGWPSHMAARILSQNRYLELRARAHLLQADAVILDGIHGFWVASRLSSTLSVPLIYRSHNREFFYLTNQRRLARGLRQFIALSLSTVGLRRRERQAHKESQVVLDISKNDLDFWRSEGFSNGIWLPPLMDSETIQHSFSETTVDFAYIGNLVTPNNVSGVLWFIEDVWPLILERKPDATIVIGGSNPTAEIFAACRSATGVTLVANVADPKDILLQGRVLVNPIWMSSGVNIKMIDMLSLGIPVVTTPHGVSGLPDIATSLAYVCKDSISFASTCLSLLEAPFSVGIASHSYIEQNFGIDILRSVFEQIEQTCVEYASSCADRGAP